MKTVYKYTLPIHDYIKLVLPKGYKPLYIGTQNDNPYLWALVDPNEQELEEVIIRCAGTGHSIRDEYSEYLGTALMMDGDFVLHYFKEE